MSRVFKIFFLICILVFPNINYASANSQTRAKKNDSSLYYEIKRLLKKYGAKDLNAGIYLKSLDDGSVKFSYHPERFFAPASVVKIFTAYEALSYLDADYKFKSFLLSDGSEPSDGVLKSDLYIKFSGDPTFTYEDLKKCLKL